MKSQRLFSGTELVGHATFFFDLKVSLISNIHLLRQALGTNEKNEITDTSCSCEILTRGLFSLCGTG